MTVKGGRRATDQEMDRDERLWRASAALQRVSDAQDRSDRSRQLAEMARTVEATS